MSTKRRRLSLIEYPSPNYSDRGGQAIQFLVLHYTGTSSLQESLDILTDKDRPIKVSSHYVVAENGDIYRLVDEKNKAWHAGISYWNGKSDLNSKSVGIEIQNAGDLHAPMPNFPAAQMNSVLTLSRQIIGRHGIRAFNVIGHSDIAPDRKQDPGEKFPWSWLASNGVGVFPAPTKSDYDASGNWDDNQVLAKLRQLGYTPNVGFKLTMTQFQRHFYPEVFATPAQVGIADTESKARLACLLRRKASADKGIATRNRKKRG